MYYAGKAVNIQFVECLSVNGEREKLEVNLNLIGYCSRSAADSLWDEISAETLIIL